MAMLGFGILAALGLPFRANRAKILRHHSRWLRRARLSAFACFAECVPTNCFSAAQRSGAAKNSFMANCMRAA